MARYLVCGGSSGYLPIWARRSPSCWGLGDVSPSGQVQPGCCTACLGHFSIHMHDGTALQPRCQLHPGVVCPQKPFCIILPFLLLHPPSSSTHPGSEPSVPCYRKVLSSDLCKCKLTLLASSLNPIAKITASALSAPLATHGPVPPVPYASRYHASSSYTLEHAPWRFRPSLPPPALPYASTPPKPAGWLGLFLPPHVASFNPRVSPCACVPLHLLLEAIWASRLLCFCISASFSGMLDKEDAVMLIQK